jgi:4-amino-4-deoxy-L-arabinose transferase-like glycosyltransferase
VPTDGPAQAWRRYTASGRRDTLLLLLAGTILFLPGLGARDLWNPDEPRYAEVAREMLLTGEYLVPHLNGDLYTQKPPLQFWAMAAAARLTGRLDEAAARLPAVISAIAAMWLVHRLGLRLFGRRAAWFAVAAFATCSKVLWQGRIGQIDMLLVALVTAAVWFWVRSWTEERPRLVLGFYLFAGLGTLAKGPVSLLPPLFGILLFLLWRRDRAGFRRLWLGRGLLLYAAVALAWLVPATLHAGPDYLRAIALRQTVERYAEPWHHFQPWYYYLEILPVDFFPWSLLVPGALVAGWTALTGRAREGLRFAIAWCVATLVFFSVSPAKRTVYILSLYPGLAIALGAGLDAIAAAWPRYRRWIVWPLAGLAVLLLAAAALVPRQAARHAVELAPLGAGVVAQLVALLLVLAIAAAAAAWLARRGAIVPAVSALALGLATATLAAVLWLLPRFDSVKSARPLSEELLRRVGPGEPYAIYPRIDSSFLFYTHKVCELPANEAELRAYAARSGRVWLLIKKEEIGKLQPPIGMVEVARDADETEGFALLTRP